MLAVGLYATHSDSTLAADVRHVYQFAFAEDLSQNTVGQVEAALARLHLAVPALRGTGAVSTHVPLNGSIETDYSSSHPEIGLVGRAGDPVLAAASGTVTNVSSGAQGVSVAIDHGASLGVTHYSGLASASVRQGEYVSVGEVIGRLPANSDKPVLHFSIEQDGRYVNPHDYIHFPSDST
jgi:murein DD-endopeptidase MepM/ murein hydrolase activator NlpD